MNWIMRICTVEVVSLQDFSQFNRERLCASKPPHPRRMRRSITIKWHEFSQGLYENAARVGSGLGHTWGFAVRVLWEVEC